MWLSLPKNTNKKLSPYSSDEAGITFHLYSITLIHWKLDCCTFCLANKIKMKKKKPPLQKNKPKAIFQAWNGRNSLYLKGIKFSWQLGIRGQYSCSLFHLTWPATLKSSSTISSPHSYHISCSFPSKSAPQMGHQMLDFSWDVKFGKLSATNVMNNVIYCTCYMASSGSWNC